MNTTMNLVNRPMQSWWDVVCNCNEENRAEITREEVACDGMFDAYYSLFFDKERTGRSSMYLTPEERFTFWCFMHWACADLGLPEAVEI